MQSNTITQLNTRCQH